MAILTRQTEGIKNRQSSSSDKPQNPVLLQSDDEQRFQPAPVTLKELHSQIPPHLFKRSLWKSSQYLLLDIVMMLTLGYMATFIDHVPDGITRFVWWVVYGFAQGVVCTGIWVIAHECGHQSFSDSAMINNSVGFVLHSFLLVPYFSWKRTHSLHHKGCSHMKKDQVFLPPTRTQLQEKIAKGPLTPFDTLVGLAKMLLVGWPAYLMFNASGQEYDVWASHFKPDSPFFEARHWRQVIQSDIGMVLTISALTYASFVFGMMNVVKFYLVPYLWVNFWLVLITFLQHTHPDIPHFQGPEWNFLQGAIATVDRSFGPLNFFFHHISDSHVAHHIFSTMPHYHALEATKIIKKVLGHHYRFDPENVFVAAYKTYQQCRFVEDQGNILYYKNK